MITTYLNALVDMLNESPPTTLAALEANLTPFKVLGYSYWITSITGDNGNFCATKIAFTGKGLVYEVYADDEYLWKGGGE
jgi:hypothetical protein